VAPGSPSGTGTQGGGEKESSNNLGAIIGGVAGALAVILVAGGLVLYRRKQQQQSTQRGVPLLSVKPSNSDDNVEQDNAPKKDPQAIVQSGGNPMNMSLRDLEIQQQRLDLKWQLLMLQQQEQQLRSPMQQPQQQSQLQQQIHQLGGRDTRASVVSANVNASNTSMGSLSPYARQEYIDISSFHSPTAPTVHTLPEKELSNRGYSELDFDPIRIPNNPHTNVLP
jgi:hypothetical protein